MHAKGFAFLSVLVMIIAAPGCDNVAWGGIDVELRPPPPAERAPAVPTLEEPDRVLRELELGPILYLVERSTGSEATLVPVAQITDEGYDPLPDAAETPDLVERFPLGRWEEGTEFALLAQGVRAGTFTSDGSVSPGTGTCQLRPRTRGRVELLPEAAGARVLLALRKDDLPSPVSPGAYPGLADSPQLRADAMDVARILIPRVQAAWPPSIPGIHRDHQPFVLEEGRPALAGSFVYADGLEVGSAPPLAYSIFFLARRENGAYQPFWSWYQRVQERGKAFPRFLAAHDVRGEGVSDVLLEVFGESHRWFTLVGPRDGSWEILYEDPCGLPVPPGAVRIHP